MAQVTTGYWPDTGKPKFKYYYGKTRRAVQDKLEKIKAEITMGLFVEPSKITLGDWIKRWLTVYKKPYIKPGSYSNYEHISRVHIIPSLGQIPLQSLQTNSIQDFYNQKNLNGRLDGTGGLSSRIIHLIHQVINGALKQAVKEKLIQYNPAEATRLPKLKYNEMSTLNQEQVRKYLDGAKGDRLYSAFLLELSTGLRRGELLALRWEDVDFKERHLTIRNTLARVRLDSEKPSTLVFSEPKTEKGKREIPLLQNILKELKSHKVKQLEEKLFMGESYLDNGLVFATPEGRPIDPRNFYRLHTKLLKDSGLPHVRFHDLRHTFATLMLEAKEEPKVLQEILGHAKISTTYDIYCKTNKAMKTQALKSIEKILFNKPTKSNHKKIKTS
ncbi:MAG: site-specific integrase [Desulfocucumaceae bacterium]